MFITFLCLALGLAGIAFLTSAPLPIFFYSADKVSSVAAEQDLVAVLDEWCTALGLGDPVWSVLTSEFQFLRLVILLAFFLTLLSVLGWWGEKQILAFLVMMEVLLVFLSILIVLLGATADFNTSAYYNSALCILAAGGADTALALALFMTYYKVTGNSTLN
jgi:NADH:ubiquinone oxidoreductase subunit K